MMKWFTLLLFAWIFKIGDLQGQQRIVAKLVDAVNGRPIHGAVISSESGLVRSGTDGIFEVVGNTDTLNIVIEHDGYGKSNHFLYRQIDSIQVVTLRNSNLLEEVLVSSGLQRIPRERSTGSFSFVGQHTLEEQVSFDILSKLPAVANSVMTDRATAGSSSLIVRGLSTIRGSKQPLVILDNFPYEGDLENINPNSIESVTILKDAAATSIWGARAGNGVIVLTSKKPSNVGRLSGTFTASNTFGSRPNLRYIPQMSSSDYIEVEEFLFRQGYYNSRINNNARPPLTPIVEMLLSYSEGGLTGEEYLARQSRLRTIDVRNSFEREIYQASFSQQYFIDLFAGGQKFNWLMSGGFDFSTDELANKSNRISLRAINTIQPISKVSLQSEMAYNSRHSIDGKPGYGDITLGAYELYPYAEFSDELGRPLTIAQRREAYIDTVGGGRLLDWHYYPLDDYRFRNQSMTLQDFTVNTGLTINLLRELNLTVSYQHKQQHTVDDLHYGINSYFARDLINLYSQLDRQTGDIIHRVPLGDIKDVKTTTLRANNFRSQFDLQKSWGSNTLALIVGGESRDLRTSGQSHRIYGLNSHNYSFGHVDYSTLNPEFIRGTLSRIPNNDDLNYRTSRFLSFFANGSYTLWDKFIISGSARRDASNLFGLKTNDKWSPFWSTGASWELSKEPFYPKGTFNYTRLRLSYGINGNINPGMSALGTIRYRNSFHYIGNRPTAWHDNYPNPDLRWETSRIINFGVDFGVLKNRIIGSMEFYFKRSFDLFGYMPNDITNGIGQEVLRNASSIKGKGLSIEITSTNIERPGVSWQTNFNISFNRDITEAHYLSTTLGRDFISTSRPSPTTIIGHPVYSIYSYQWVGLSSEAGDPIGILEGEPSANYTQILNNTELETMLLHGAALPTAYGSIGNRFKWRDFQLDIRISYKAGYYFRRYSINYTHLFSRGTGHSDFEHRWLASGDETSTYVPSMVYPNNSSRDAFFTGIPELVERGDHIRLRYVTLHYQFSNFKIFFNANNLGIIWRANTLGIDPDYHGLAVMPPIKTFSVGARVNF